MADKAVLYIRVPITIKEYLDKYAEENKLSINQAAVEHLEASMGKVRRRGPELITNGDI